MPKGIYLRTEEHGKNLSLAWDYDKHFTLETRKKISLANTGKKRTEETRQKMSLVRKGKSHVAWNKGLTGPCYMEHFKNGFALKGKHHSEKSKKKMSLAHKEIKGGRHANWQGGISFEPYGLEFNNTLRNIVRRRDNFICQECGITQEQLGYVLNVHHIDFDKKNNNFNNFISLCKSCHMQTNFNREEWTEYFQNKLAKNKEVSK